jgi:hypothetical protein
VVVARRAGRFEFIAAPSPSATLARICNSRKCQRTALLAGLHRVSYLCRMSDTAKIVYARIAAQHKQRPPGEVHVIRIDELGDLNLSELEIKDGLEHLRGAQLLTRTPDGLVLTEEGTKACARSEDLDKALFP